MPRLNFLPPWPDPQESIGRQVPSSRVRNRMVWWPRGPALEIFEKFIQPEIENLLKVVDLGHADLFIRLYMIGRKPESANPIVMVCCTNSKSRDAAEGTIRESGLLGGHKGIGLGGAALPLEHPTPVRRLSPNNQGRNMPAESSEHDPADIYSRRSLSSTIANLPFRPQSGRGPYPSTNSFATNDSSPFIIDTLPSSTESNNSNSGPVVFASSTEPSIGRRISTSTISGHDSHHYATAGVVIQVGENYYQLTAGHLFEVKNDSWYEEEPQIDSDECHFDGQSEDDERNSNYESEIGRRGSATPDDILSSSYCSTNEETTRSYNTNVHRESHPAFNRQHEKGKILALERIENRISTDNKFLQNPSTLGRRLPIGCLPHGKSFQASIDYAIIAISRDSVENLNSTINRTFWPFKFVKDYVEVGHEERRIIVVTYSKNIEGLLIPGKVASRDHRTRQFEQSVQVILEGEVFEGDCGSPVLDSSSGSLYGHVIMGVAGTKVAYIVPAVDIFRDIETRIGKPVSIVTKEDGVKMKTPTNGSDISLSSTSSIFSHASSSTSAPSEGLGLDPTIGSLPCEFIGYGGCAQTFAWDDVDNWIEHIISKHLNGNLPKKVICWFCDDATFDYRETGETGDRRVNFEHRMWHIRSHILDGMNVHDIRPDHFLTAHLKKYRLVPEYAYHVVRRYAEVPQPNWIVPHDGVPADWEGEYGYNNPLEETRKSRKYRHRSGKSKK
ncbi:hypothetical protein F4782DRAFT_484147 [Xylaria castorea]|nr:hypothetical protein F4782DRAFT_484147 [Xylaria castorea]